jgi:hypothetical protein
VQRSRSIREVLEALDWVRREMMHRGSPDFIRQRQLERGVKQLAARLTRSESSGSTEVLPRNTSNGSKHGTNLEHRK